MTALVNLYASRQDGYLETVVHAYVVLGAEDTLSTAQLGLSDVISGYGIADSTGERFELDCIDQDAMKFVGLPYGGAGLHVTVRGRQLRTKRELNLDVHPDELDPPRHEHDPDAFNPEVYYMQRERERQERERRVINKVGPPSPEDEPEVEQPNTPGIPWP